MLRVPLLTIMNWLKMALLTAELSLSVPVDVAAIVAKLPLGTRIPPS